LSLDKNAIIRANAGRSYDTDPNTPGTQEPNAQDEPQTRRREPGRVLAQFERTVKDLKTLREDSGPVDMTHLTAAHRQRTEDVLDDLKPQLAELERLWAGPGGRRRSRAR